MLSESFVQLSNSIVRVYLTWGILKIRSILANMEINESETYFYNI